MHFPCLHQHNGRLNHHQSTIARACNHAPPPPPSAHLTQRAAASITYLTHGLVERDTEARLLLLAALGGEHLVLVGPPGTAKSLLCSRLAYLCPTMHAAEDTNGGDARGGDAHGGDARGGDARGGDACDGPVTTNSNPSIYTHPLFFTRLLTRFTVPEELFGPLSMRALEEDRWVLGGLVLEDRWGCNQRVLVCLFLLQCSLFFMLYVYIYSVYIVIKDELPSSLHMFIVFPHPLHTHTHAPHTLSTPTCPAHPLHPLTPRTPSNRYERHTAGYLPEARVAFIDEIFKANSAILNTLLTILQERQFHNGTEMVVIPLQCLV